MAPNFVALLVLTISAFRYPAASQRNRPTGFYVDGGLNNDQSVVFTPSKQGARIFQREILHLLGLEQSPRPIPNGKRQSAPRYMLSLYHALEHDPENIRAHLSNEEVIHVNTSLSGRNSRTYEANMIMSFRNKASRSTVEDASNPFRMRFSFDFSRIPLVESVEAAEFRVFKNKVSKLNDGSNPHHPFRLLLYKSSPDNSAGNSRLPEINATIPSTSQGWIVFDMTSAAAEETEKRSSNFGLYLQVEDSYGRNVDLSDFGIVWPSVGAEDRQAFMVTFFKARNDLHSRQRRSSPRKRQQFADDTSTMNDPPTDGGWSPDYSANYFDVDSSKRRTCQRRTLFVNFRQLQWHEWIIAPDGYSAFYCQGECEFPNVQTNMNATNHAIVQTLVNLMSNAAPKPCCAPTKLSGNTVLYFDNDENVILKTFKNMIVEACGCQ